MKKIKCLFSKCIIFFWTCEIKGFGVKDKNIEITEDKYQMFFDTGANGILVPEKIFLKIIDLYAPSLKNKCKFRFIEGILICYNPFKIQSIPKIIFNLGQFNITLSPHDIFMKDESKKGRAIYYSRMLSWPQNTVIMGTSILKRYLTIFDMDDGSIGVVENKDYKEFSTIIRPVSQLINVLCYVFIGAIVLWGFVFMCKSQFTSTKTMINGEQGIPLNNIEECN